MPRTRNALKILDHVAGTGETIHAGIAEALKQSPTSKPLG